MLLLLKRSFDSVCVYFYGLHTAKRCTDLLKLDFVAVMFTFRLDRLIEYYMWCSLFFSVPCLLFLVFPFLPMHFDFVRLVDISHPHIWIFVPSVFFLCELVSRCSLFAMSNHAMFLHRSQILLHQLTCKMCVCGAQLAWNKRKEITMLKCLVSCKNAFKESNCYWI